MTNQKLNKVSTFYRQVSLNEITNSLARPAVGFQSNSNTAIAINSVSDSEKFQAMLLLVEI